MNFVTRKIDRLGRVVLPIDYRKKLKLETDSEILVEIEGDSLILRTADSSCKLCGQKMSEATEIGLCDPCIARVKSI